MEVQGTSVIQPELRETLLSALDMQVEANKYKTRGLPIRMQINGQEELWHSVKGGVNPANKGNIVNPKNVSYEIFFNPESKTWLKSVPPEAVENLRLDHRLRLSAQIGREALELSGLPELATKIIDCENLQIEGVNLYGFLSPHIGPSIQYCLDVLQRGNWATSGAMKFFGEVYNIAYNQAARLYLNFGYWTSDPNPGNILLHFKNDSIYVTLIDFSNRKQLANNKFDDIPIQYLSKRERNLQKALLDLHKLFQDQCLKHNIPYQENPLQQMRHFLAQYLISPR